MIRKKLLFAILGTMMLAAPAAADVVQLRTAAPVGEKMYLALNSGVEATLTWGDGTVEKVKFDGEEKELTVKHAELSLATEQLVTTVYCPDCSLTELDVTDAPRLAVLVCADNQLKKLDVSKNEQLRDLDCSGNQLSAMTVGKCCKLVSLNVGNNNLTTLTLGGLADLQTLICSDNKLKTLYTNSQTDLQALWCQNNELTKIVFAGAARPAHLVAFRNQLTQLTPVHLSGVKELWVDSNRLQEIDLSNAAPEVVSASHNQLTSVLLNKDEKQALKAYYVDDNGLMINSLPTVMNGSFKDTLVAYNIENQAPYRVVDEPSIALGDRIQFSDLYRVNAWKQYTRSNMVLKNAAGSELVKDKDFKLSGSTYAFLLPHKGVYAEITSPLYPGAVFTTVPFDVIDPTGVEDVLTADLQVQVLPGALQVTVAAATPLKVYNISGVAVIDEVVAKGTHRWNLPAGVYVVNGQKVALGK